MRRYETTVESGTVYVETGDDRLQIGAVEHIADAVGGYAWTIEYSDWEREYYDSLNTDDEGLTVDVVDMIRAMTHGQSFVETLRAHPRETETDSEDSLPPRMGLFVGKLLENLETGLD